MENKKGRVKMEKNDFISKEDRNVYRKKGIKEERREE